MSQEPLAFLLPLFGADHNLLTKRCMFGKEDSRGQLSRGGLPRELGGDACVCVREGRGVVMVGGVIARRSPGVSN